MGTCFIIQPFDQGPFDKRYEEVLVPAITDAGLEPYRVDRDPGASIPIEQIEAGIRAADVCLADITTDNPNVWFELGFAIASRKEVILICAAARRSGFPFDIQHRAIITYSTESASDFQDLTSRIKKRLKAILSKEARLESATSASAIASVEGLSQHEMVGLVSLAQNLDSPPGGTVSAYMIRQDMEKAGFTRVAVTLALAGLLKKQLIDVREFCEEEYDRICTLYSLTEKGIGWLTNNQERLVLKEPTDEVPF